MVANTCPGPGNLCTGGVVGVLLGNGDGTFQTAVLTARVGMNPRLVRV